jgi:DNA topoisomerase IB
MKPPKTAKEFKAKRDEIGTMVSERLCNTRSVALSAYIAPSVFQQWKKDLSKADQEIVSSKFGV